MLESGEVAQTTPSHSLSKNLKNKSPKLENYTADSVFLKTDIIFRNNSSLHYFFYSWRDTKVSL